MDALTKYVRDNLGRPFVWGERDCLTFANEAIRVHTGVGPFDGFMNGTYDSLRGAVSMFNARNIEEPLSDVADRMWDRQFTLHPDHGCLVSRPVPPGTSTVFGMSFGVVVLGRCAMVSVDRGVILTPPVTQDMFWRTA